MVSAAHPAAADAGVQVLRSGGNAVDAAVAVQMVLSFVEPSQSGLGGGAFMLYRDGISGEFTVYDGRETAPAAAQPERFTVFGVPLPVWAAVPTGLSVGVPGTLALLHLAHQGKGSQPWNKLVQPAIRCAKNGIPMPEKLQRKISNDLSLWLFADTRNYFVFRKETGQPRWRNRKLARSLDLIASEGPEVFYEGRLARQMVAAAQNRWPGRSDLTVEDFKSYSPEKRDAVCGRYRQWTVCGVPAPSSGALAIIQVLGILEHFSLGSFIPGDPKAIHLIAEASRLAFADRAEYIGDPAFIDVPEQALIDPDYLAGRAALIDPDRAMDHAAAGQPTKSSVPSFRHLPEKITGGTSHFSIVDSHGSVVSMTSSIESSFGSRIMACGFLLNNQLTDFDFRPTQNGVKSPNAVEAGKRPRSSMAPLVVLDRKGNTRLILGSRGGARIIGYVIKSLVGVLDWDLPLQKAIALPNFLHCGEVLELEQGTPWANHAVTLEIMGHKVRILPLESGTHGIERVLATDSKSAEYFWRGAADPRTGGIAKGDRHEHRKGVQSKSEPPMSVSHNLSD